MDSLRGLEDTGFDEVYEDDAIEAPPVISESERRMQVRAYNYWVSLLGRRSFPSIEDLNPEEMSDFGANSVLLDFSMGLENPAVLYLGSALREECGITGTIERIDQVPTRSLLSRLTDHYLQIIANAAPVGFEAEFVNQRGADIMYRGILMPFSSNDETIDFIYGVINWKEMASQTMLDGLGEEIRGALREPAALRSNAAPIWSEGPSATADFDFDFDDAEDLEEAEDDADALFLDASPDETAELDLASYAVEAPLDLVEFEALEEEGVDELMLTDDLIASAPDAVEEHGEEPDTDSLALSAGDPVLIEGEASDEAPETDVLDEEPVGSASDEQDAADNDSVDEDRNEGEEGDGLSVWLSLARKSAADVDDCDARSRTALYRAIGNAYDFALKTRDAPEDYAALLKEAKIGVQARSPNTAVIKLVFGADHDKTRIAEYACALDYAFTRELGAGELPAHLLAHDGGIKGLVRDMRAQRRAEKGVDKKAEPATPIDRAARQLADAGPVEADALPFDEHGLAVVVARREVDGAVTLVAGVDLSNRHAQKILIEAGNSV